MQNELILPKHMIALDQETINDLLALVEERIIACGVDPHDKSLIFVTNKMSVRTISPNGKLMPTSSVPSETGNGMWITMQGIKGVFPIDVETAMKYSVQYASNGDLIVNNKFVCNVDLSTDI